MSNSTPPSHASADREWSIKLSALVPASTKSTLDSSTNHATSASDQSEYQYKSDSESDSDDELAVAPGSRRRWTQAETKELASLVEGYTLNDRTIDWGAIRHRMGGRTIQACQARWKHVRRLRVKQDDKSQDAKEKEVRRWSAWEEKLLATLQAEGKSWRAIGEQVGRSKRARAEHWRLVVKYDHERTRSPRNCQSSSSTHLHHNCTNARRYTSNAAAAGPSHGDVKPRLSDLGAISPESDTEAIEIDEEDLQAESDRLDQQIQQVEGIMNKRQKLATLLAKRSTTLLTRVKTEVKAEEIAGPLDSVKALTAVGGGKWKGKGRAVEVIEIEDSD